MFLAPNSIALSNPNAPAAIECSLPATERPGCGRMWKHTNLLVTNASSRGRSQSLCSAVLRSKQIHKERWESIVSSNSTQDFQYSYHWSFSNQWGTEIKRWFQMALTEVLCSLWQALNEASPQVHFLKLNPTWLLNIKTVMNFSNFSLPYCNSRGYLGRWEGIFRSIWT